MIAIDTMRANVFHGPEDIRVEEVDRPRPGPGEALLRVTLTTICGMVPLTVGGPTSIGLSYRSFGFTLIGGLTSATLLTLLVVPVLYTLFDDAREAFGEAARRGWRGRRARGAEGAPAADGAG